MLRNTLLFMIILIQIGLQGNATAASSEMSWEHFAEEIKLLNIAVRDGEYERAKYHTDRMNRLFPRISESISLSTEALHELSDCIISVRSSLRAVRLNTQTLQQQVDRILLAADAVKNRDDPLLISSLNVLREDVHNSVANGERSNLTIREEQIKIHLQKWQVIRSALIIAEEAAFVHKIDSLFVYLQIRKNDVQEMDVGLRTLYEALGEHNDKTTFMPLTDFKRNPELLTYTSLLFAFVAVVLTFVIRKIYIHETS